jgi:hypothetical protein
VLNCQIPFQSKTNKNIDEKQTEETLEHATTSWIHGNQGSNHTHKLSNTKEKGKNIRSCTQVFVQHNSCHNKKKAGTNQPNT